MTILFIGHGSPMNALEENPITKSWQELGKTLPKPKAILAISAHWYVPYLAVSSREINDTIHDFYGFPPQLANFDYPSRGSIELANNIIETLDLADEQISSNSEWGIDHGVWSILTHMYPKLEIPVIQLSIDSRKAPLWHYQLGQKLQKFAQGDILILCSGNIVHNLRLLDWHMANTGYDWAVESDKVLVDLITNGEIDKLCNYNILSENMKLAIPTLEHFLPILYALGAYGTGKIEIFNQTYSYGSLSMTSFLFR